ncbi:hypothetical protein FQR65_LT04425 [Abscondita terminalis]|nr:hypothetical protein FQR65_LT04425 [Abscondita terminalis]
MPGLEKETIIKVLSPNSSLHSSPHILSPVTSELSFSNVSEIDLDYGGLTFDLPYYFPFEYAHLPHHVEPTLHEILARTTDINTLDSVRKVDLQILSLEISLQQISIYIPFLKELILDGSCIVSLRDLGTGLKYLKVLSVARCGLTNLDGIFCLDSLEEFYVQDNKIEDLSPCVFLPEIRVLNLKGNLLVNILTVNFLSACKYLEHLVLDDNINICQLSRYRTIIKLIIPNLQTLDGKDVRQEDVVFEGKMRENICNNRIQSENTTIELIGFHSNQLEYSKKENYSFKKKLDENGQFVRLINVKEPSRGNIYGILHSNTLVVVGVYIQDEDKTDITQGFPTEIDIYGVIQIGNEAIDEEKIKQILNEVDVTDTPLYITCKFDSEPNIIEAFFNINNRLELTNFEIVTENQIYSEFIHVRLITQLPFMSDVTTQSVSENFLNLRKKLVNGQIVFNFPNTKVYIKGNECANELVGLLGNPTVREICKESTDIIEGSKYNNRMKKIDFNMEVLEVNMLKKITRECGLDNCRAHAPVVHIEKSPGKLLMLTVNIDSLSLVHREEKIINLYSVLIESCCRFLRLLEGVILNNVKSCNNDYSLISQPETFHFFPKQCGHFITRIYVKSEAEELMEKTRLILHKQLLLPIKQPLFRRANRYIFNYDIHGSRPLVNPHEHLNPVKSGGEIALVKGKYSYYHYCQNNMDDNGWGCAYRSLQTLASWFCFQGYTNKEVPTFDDIQKCLVNIGDKPPNFVGSKQWIGSTEVSFVLNSLLDVTSKIIYVSSGEDMACKGSELIYHFQTYGSPVMIGGGVLAHTILGVDYNHVTGEIKFLILDPHYTGEDNIDIILKKGWCGWKPLKFWDKTAYYNMCLPQVSICV